MFLDQILGQKKDRRLLANKLKAKRADVVEKQVREILQQEDQKLILSVRT